MNILIALLAGLLFGLGLVVSGMANPAKVIGFLDIAGNWDPSLALVMAGAITVGLGAFRIAGLRQTTLLGHPMQLPTVRHIDRRLILGSAIFGAGWGLAGICPGPAFVLAATDIARGWIFILSMLAGMSIHQLLQRRPGNGFFLARNISN